MKEYEDLLTKLIENDDQYLVMTAENRALIRNLPNVIGDKFIDTGITEQTMIGMAAGLALRGRIPICHALAAFLTMRAFEFIRTDVGIANLNVKLCGFIPGVLSDANGPTHQAIEDISIMRGIPNMHVFAPADADDMLQMLPSIWSSPHPSYVRVLNQHSTYKHSNFQYGKAEIIGQGSEATILVYGYLFNESYKAWQSLNEEGFSVGLVNMRCLKPLDESLVIELVDKDKPLIIVEDHFHTGGLYSLIAELLLKHNKRAKVLSISFKERWFKPALLTAVLEHEKMNSHHIKKTIIHSLLNSSAHVKQ